jgi:hypothetical protein
VSFFVQRLLYCDAQADSRGCFRQAELTYRRVPYV